MNRILILVSAICLAYASPLAAQETAPTYWKDIRPIFRKHCIFCHSKRYLAEPEVSGSLALDSYELIPQSGKRALFQKGKSDKSLLLHRLVIDDRNKRMPLDSRPLSKEKIALIRNWIDRGALEGKNTGVKKRPRIAIKRRPRRRLDVILKTTTTPPTGRFGKIRRAKLELRLKIGPLSPVTAVAFSPDGRFLAAGQYGLVTVWDLTKAQPAHLFTNVLGAVNDLQFSPDGKYLAVGGGQPSAKGDLRLFRVADWKLHAVARDHEDVVFSVDFNPKGDMLASASFDKTVRLWKTPELTHVQTLTSHSDFVYAVAFGPDGKSLASASKDRSVRLMDVETGDSRFTFSGMNQNVTAVAFSPDGKHVVSSGFESQLYWWDPATGKQIRRQSGHGVAVNEIQFSRDGAKVVSAASDRTVRIWNGKSGALMRTISVGDVTYAVAIGPKAKFIASGGYDGLTRIWDEKTGRQVLTLMAAPAEDDEPNWLVQTPQGYTVASSAFVKQGRWIMSGSELPGPEVWKSLQQPSLVAQFLKTQKVGNPQFSK